MDAGGLNRYLELWGKPVSPHAPCGEDCAFSEAFETLRSEVEKDASLHVGNATDWGAVSRLAADFLGSQSKDLWALVYALYAEYRLNGLSACPSAFAALTHILSTWWDELHPSATRFQRRMAPLAWLCGRMEHVAETTCFVDGSADTVRDLRAAFDALQVLLDDKVGEAAPSFAGIFARVPELSQERPDAGSSGGAPPGHASRPATPLAASLADMDKDGRIPTPVLPQLIHNIMDQTRQLAGHFLSMNPTDERAYLLHRAALWGTLLQLPQADAAGKTQLISGIPADKLQAYAAAVDGKQYAEVLPSLERSAGRSPYWFDGHVMVLRCLEGLKAGAAAACVRESLTGLLGRFPELLTYKFKDGAPFASAKTLPLLENLRAPASGGEPLAAMPGLDAADAENLLREAVALGTEESFAAGLRHLGGVPPGRSRGAVLHALLQAKYCLYMGKKDAAERLLSALYAQMKDWNLLDWEPELTARVLALLLSSLSSQAKRRGDAAEDMIRCLHWLHLDTAINIMQEH